MENAQAQELRWSIATACKAVRQATVEYDEVIVALSKRLRHSMGPQRTQTL